MAPPNTPPAGSCPQGFWAEVECAFLNAHQARWQYVADTMGIPRLESEDPLEARQRGFRTEDVLRIVRPWADAVWLRQLDPRAVEADVLVRALVTVMQTLGDPASATPAPGTRWRR